MRNAKPMVGWRARRMAAWATNLALPGTGLVAEGKPWLGTTLAVLFGVCGHTAIAGTWVAPKQWPAWVTTLAWLLAAAVWVQAQWLLRRSAVE